MGGTSVTRDGRSMTVRVPISIRRRGGRKLVLAPDGAEVAAAVTRRVDNAVIKAIARAFRWREMLENGTYATIAEIAAAEKINESYVARMLRLTLLAPEIVDGILGGRQPTQMTLAVLMRRVPMYWSAQRAELLHPAPRNRSSINLSPLIALRWQQ